MSVADELHKLVALRDAGDISQAEFDAGKQQVLGAAAPAATAAPTVAPEESKGISGPIFLGALVLFAVGVTWHWVSNPSEDEVAQRNDKDAITACWMEQERRSMTPEQQRFIADRCEKLEDGFRSKYRRNP